MTVSSASAFSVLAASKFEDLGLVLYGFALVLIILSVLWLAASLIGRFFIAQEPKAKPAAPASAPAQAPPEPQPATPRGMDPHLVAVAAAAARIMLDQPVRIHSIRTVRGGWAAEGRRDIHSSHRLR
jgi:Na+-transporting methylmalonyl-CoA/oxaloacetate decarboxylase gamma subunit